MKYEVMRIPSYMRGLTPKMVAAAAASKVTPDHLVTLAVRLTGVGRPISSVIMRSKRANTRADSCKVVIGGSIVEMGSKSRRTHADIPAMSITTITKLTRNSRA